VKTILVNQLTKHHSKLLEVLVCFVKRLINKEEDKLLSTKEDRFATGPIILLGKFVGVIPQEDDPSPDPQHFIPIQKVILRWTKHLSRPKCRSSKLLPRPFLR
jgi:hypothetical protein